MMRSSQPTNQSRAAQDSTVDPRTSSALSMGRLPVQNKALNEVFDALAAGDVRRARHLLEQQPTLAHEKNAHGVTALHEAAEKGMQDIVELLLSQGADVDAKDRYEHTPLFKATWFLNWDIALMLLEKGANVNIQDADGHVLLHWAAFQGDREMINLLLSHGADVTAKDRDGRTPLEYAHAQGHREAAALIEKVHQNLRMLDRKNQLKYPNLDRAIEMQDLEEVKAHLRFAKDHAPNHHWNPSLLHEAVLTGNLDIVEILLEHGFDLNFTGPYGVTALHIAVEKNYEKIAQVLLARGAFVVALDFDGKTPLDLAKEKNNSTLIKLIQKYMPSERAAV